MALYVDKFTGLADEDILIRDTSAHELLDAGNGNETVVSSGTMQRIYKCALSYYKHNNDLVYMHKPSADYNYETGRQADGRYYGYNCLMRPHRPTVGLSGIHDSDTPYKNEQGEPKVGMAINCSAFAFSVMLGIPYEWSTYNSSISASADNIGRAGYCFNPWFGSITDENVDTFNQTQRMFNRLASIGRGRKLANDYSNCQPGDILFCSHTDDPSGIYHCGICLAVSPIPFDAESTNPKILIAEVINAPYPVRFLWKSASTLVADDWKFVGRPVYQTTPPMEDDVIIELEKAYQSFTAEGFNLTNGEIVTLDFDWYPQSTDVHLNFKINGGYPKSPNIIRYMIEVYNSGELTPMHYTIPIPVSLDDYGNGNINHAVTSLTFDVTNVAGHTDTIRNMKVVRGLKGAGTLKPVIAGSTLAEYQSNILALFPTNTNRVFTFSRECITCLDEILEPVQGVTLSSSYAYPTKITYYGNENGTHVRVEITRFTGTFVMLYEVDHWVYPS